MGNVFPRTAADVVGPQRRLRLCLCEDSPEDKRGLRLSGKVNSLPVLCFRLFSGRKHGDLSRRRLSCTVVESAPQLVLAAKRWRGTLFSCSACVSPAAGCFLVSQRKPLRRQTESRTTFSRT